MIGIKMKKNEYMHFVLINHIVRAINYLEYHTKCLTLFVFCVFSQAVREPVIAEPHVSDGYPIDSCSSFLLIMSDGLYHALQDATETARVNTEVAQMVAVEFNVQSTLNGVAQACVDKVVRIHHDSFMMGTPDVKARCHKRGDITLLVRNFNYILPNAIGTPTGGSRFLPVSVPYYPSTRPAVPPSISIPDSTPLTFGNEGIQDEATTPVASDPSPSRSPGESSLLDTNREQTRDSQASTETYSTTNSTQSSEETRFPSRFYKREKLILDENGRVEAYVDFSDFYRAIEAMTESQRETLNNETKPKSGYETIVEEPTGAASSPTVASQPLPGTSTDT
jgi:TAK1-binding protein 1